MKNISLLLILSLITLSAGAADGSVNIWGEFDEFRGHKSSLWGKLFLYTVWGPFLECIRPELRSGWLMPSSKAAGLQILT